MIIRTVPWIGRLTGRSARLNAAHPLASRLVHGYVFSEASGTTVNIAQGGIAASLKGSDPWVVNSTGPAMRVASGGISAGITAVIPQPPFHIVAGISNAVDSTEAFQGLVLSIQDGNAYTNATWGFSFGFRPTDNQWVSDGNASFSGGAAGSYLTWNDAATNVFASGSSHHIHLACETSGSTLYRNGVSLGTAGVAVPGTTPQPLTFGGNVFDWMQLKADFEYVYIISGSLSASDIEDLRANPYGLVEPDYERLFFDAGTPTRFYLPTSGTTTITPAFDSAWDDTSSVTRRPANTTKGTSAFAEVSDTETSTSNTWDVALGQFISDPLVAQTIAGTVYGVIRAREDNASANARSQMVVRVVSSDGATVRGTLLAQNNTTTNINEWVVTTTATSARNAYFPVGSTGAAVTPVTVQNGDRIVIEVGGRAVNTASTTYTLAMRFGENASDAALNESATTEAAPWIELSYPVEFAAAAPPAQSVAAAATAPKPAAIATSTQTSIERSVTAAATATKPAAVATATQVNPYPSLKFDNDTGHIRYPITTAWYFPDTDWTVGIIASIANPAGSASQYLISTGAYGGTQSFNLLAYEASSGTPGRIELNIRGSGSAISVVGANDTTLINSDWRLWIVERVKATETFNIYYVPVNGTRTLYATASSAGFDGSTSTTPTALATRAPPASGSLRWMDGSIYSVFKIDELLTSSEMQSLASGWDLITDLGRAPVLLTRLKDLNSPVANSGSVSNATGTINGGVTTIAGPAFSPAIPSSFNVSATPSAPKPTISATSTQSFPARSVVGSVVAQKPTATATSTQTFPARSVAGFASANKPTAAAVSTQTSITRTVTANAPAKKPAASATATQTSISRFVVAAIAATKPTASSTATQTFPARAVTATVSANKPTAAASAVQVFPARAVSGVVAAKKPAAIATAAQEFPSRDLTAFATAHKPTITAAATSSRTVQAAASAKKPAVVAAAEQTFPARSLTATAAAKKPTASAVAVQEFPAISVIAAALAPKPSATATAQQEFTERYVEAAVDAPKPTATAEVYQSTIGSVSVFGSAEAPSPTAAATAIQIFPARAVSASALAPKPTAAAIALTTRQVSAAAQAPKPVATATAGQTYPARNVSGTASVKKPMLTATATHPYPAHIVSAAADAPKPTANATAIQVRGVSTFATAPKPTAAATATQVYPPRFLNASAAAQKPTVQAFVEQIFPVRSVNAIAVVTKPTAAATAIHGPSPGAAHIANTVHMSGVIDIEQRIAGSIDMDILIAGAIEIDIAVTGFIEE